MRVKTLDQFFKGENTVETPSNNFRNVIKLWSEHIGARFKLKENEQSLTVSPHPYDPHNPVTLTMPLLRKLVKIANENNASCSLTPHKKSITLKAVPLSQEKLPQPDPQPAEELASKYALKFIIEYQPSIEKEVLQDLSKKCPIIPEKVFKQELCKSIKRQADFLYQLHRKIALSAQILVKLGIPCKLTVDSRAYPRELIVKKPVLADWLVHAFDFFLHVQPQDNNLLIVL